MNRRVTIVVLVLALLAAVFGFSSAYEHERAIDLSRAAGWCALALLFASLTCGSLRRLRRWNSHLRVLKEDQRLFGLASTFFAIVHLGFTARWFPVSEMTTFSHTRTGVVAVALLALLALTSFPRLTKRLRWRLWKPLHRLVYVVVGLSLLHIWQSPSGHPSVLIGTTLVAVLLLVTRLRTRKF